MAEDQKSEKEKKPYVKPEIEEVPLVPNEAVLGICADSNWNACGSAGCGALQL